MTTTVVSPVSEDLKLQQWKRDYFREFYRENQFADFMAASPTSVIHMHKNLGVGNGSQVTIPLVTKLAGGGVRGGATLKGNEVQLGNFGHKITVEYRRQGVGTNGQQQLISAIDMPKASRDMLQVWSKDTLRDDVIEAAQSPVLTRDANGRVVSFSSATEAQKDDWVSTNFDRILCGTSLGNLDSAGGAGTLGNYDLSDSLASIDATQKMSPSIISLAKRLAKLAEPKIRPFKLKNGRDCYVLFCDSYQYRDFLEATEVQNALRSARERSTENPIFTDNIFYWNGVYVVEVEEMPLIGDVGASGASVGNAVLCGAQAFGLAYGQMPTPKTDLDDYDFLRGFAIEEIRGLDKMFFNNKQHGAVSIFTASAPDA
ncbi:MAG: DUF4043 family protein [Myxococcota bacterium]